MICEIIFNYETLDKFQVCLRRSWKNTAYLSHRYFIDMIFMYIIMSAVKLFTGAHRPHFFESCQPDRLSDCVLGTFVSDYKCLRTSEIRFNLDDASMSFFSGHASTCVYSCLFIVWYLHKRVKSTSLFLVSFMQVSLICLAYFGSISRVFDHRHHWWDVLAGGLVGILTTYHAVSSFCVRNISGKSNSFVFSASCCVTIAVQNQINCNCQQRSTTLSCRQTRNLQMLNKQK